MKNIDFNIHNLNRRPGRPRKIDFIPSTSKKKPGRPKKNVNNMRVEALASDPNIIIIDGKKYILDRITTKKIDKVEHSDKAIFKPLKEDELKEDMDLIVNSLGKKTTAEELIREIMKEVPAKMIRRVAKRIREKKPIKKQHGCLGFKCGDSYIGLVG